MGEGERKRGRWIGTKGRGVGGRKGEREGKERLSRREGRERRKRRRGRRGERRLLCSAEGCWQKTGFPLRLCCEKEKTHKRPTNLQPQLSSHSVLHWDMITHALPDYCCLHFSCLLGGEATGDIHQKSLGCFKSTGVTCASRLNNTCVEGCLYVCACLVDGSDQDHNLTLVLTK